MNREIDFLKLSDDKKQLVYHAVKILQEALGYDGSESKYLTTFIVDNNQNSLVHLGVSFSAQIQKK